MGLLHHPLLKATLTGFRKTYLRFLVFRPKLAETKRFPPILVHMNGKNFPGGSRFPSAKIDLKLAVGGSRSHNNGQEQYWKWIILAQKDDTFRHQWTKNYVSGQVQVPNIGQNQLPRIANSSYCYYYCVTKNLDGHISGTK